MNTIPVKPMTNRQQEIIDFLAKWGAVGTYIMVGLAGKFGLDLVSGKKLSYRYILGSGLLAICAGWITYQWCLKYPALSPGVTVSIAALVSRDFILFITMVDWASVFKIITGKGAKKEEVKKDD